MRDLPEWSEEFRDNLEDTEVPALANTSQDSDSEHPSKVASRKHRLHTHFPKRLKSLQSNPDDKGSLQEGALAKQYLGQKMLVT